MDAKIIPGTCGFMASKTGVIYDASMNVRPQYTNGDGYKTASVKMQDNQTWITFGVHRLVAMAHIELDGNFEDYTVNHRDGSVDNNCVKNLEWVSVALNNSHAALMKGSSKRPLILARKAAAVRFITDLNAAAEEFGCDIDMVWECIRDSRPIEGWILSHHKRNGPIPISLRKEQFMQVGRVGKIPMKNIRMLNVRTKEVLAFESVVSAAKHFEVDPSHISQLVCIEGQPKLFKREYLVVSGDDAFPEISEKQIYQMLGPTGMNVLAYNWKLQMYCIYESASKFIRENGLSKKAVSVDLKKGRLRKYGDWTVTYLNAEAKDKLRAFVNCPDPR